MYEGRDENHRSFKSSVSIGFVIINVITRKHLGETLIKRFLIATADIDSGGIYDGYFVEKEKSTQESSEEISLNGNRNRNTTHLIRSVIALSFNFMPFNE